MMDEHMREKEIAKLQTEDDARRQDEARMMAKLNEIFDYSYDATEDGARKRR